LEAPFAIGEFNQKFAKKMQEMVKNAILKECIIVSVNKK